MTKHILLALALVLVLLTACSPAAPPTPAPTPKPSDTPAPTSTPQPTNTLAPTATNTAVPTNTPVPTATNTRTATPLPSATPTPSTPTSVVFTDDFEANRQLRVVDDADRAFGYEQGEYFMLSKKGGYMWRTGYSPTYADAVISVEARAPTGDTGVEYGLAFRATSDGKYYFFAVNPSGEYGLSYYSPTTQWVNLVRNTASPAVKPGAEKNRLQVIMQGNQIALYANDQHLDTVDNSNLASGTVQLAFSTENDNGKVVFDNVIISQINRPLTLPPGKARPPTPAPMPDIPPGMGGLIVFNYYGKEINFDIGSKLYKVPANGSTIIYLPPGNYSYSADIPGLGRAGGKIDIVAGRYVTSSWAAR